ncbi:MAG: hypothetical protein H0V66_13600 [Bdellovibrionales bacterium]|nr:hypothetical protein [Bdellovibrionales bacterium]
MKVLLALAVLATSATSFAADRDLYDIMYLPSAGTTFGISELEYIKNDVESDAGDSENSGYGLTQTVGHSFTDRLSVAASLGYRNLEFDPEVGSKTEQTGITDPTISARFRTMDETARWDIVGGALISVMDSELESNGDTDNLQGGHALFVGTQFGTKTESFQWAVLGQLKHNMERTIDVSGFGDADYDANNELLVRGDILNKLAEKSFLRSFVSVNFVEKLKSDDAGDTAPITTSTLGTEYQHLCKKDLLLRGGVDYAMNNYDSATVDSDNVWTFRVAANYQF